MELHPTEFLPFDLFFASIVGMNLHPGAERDGAKRKSLVECATLALHMIEVRRQLIYQNTPVKSEESRHEQAH